MNIQIMICLSINYSTVTVVIHNNSHDYFILGYLYFALKNISYNNFGNFFITPALVIEYHPNIIRPLVDLNLG